MRKDNSGLWVGIVAVVLVGAVTCYFERSCKARPCPLGLHREFTRNFQCFCVLDEPIQEPLTCRPGYSAEYTSSGHKFCRLVLPECKPKGVN